MANVKGFCRWVGQMSHKATALLDPSWHDFWNKSDFLKGMLGRAEALQVAMTKAEGPDGMAVGTRTMKAFRSASAYAAEVETMAGRQAGEYRKAFNAALKADVAKLVRDRKRLEEISTELGFTPKADMSNVPDDLDDKAMRLAEQARNLVVSTELKNPEESRAFAETRKILSVRKDESDVKETVETLAHWGDILKGFDETETLFRDPAYGLKFDAILAEFTKRGDSLYQGSFFEAMYDKSYANFRHFLVSEVPPTPLDSSKQALKGFQDRIREELKNSGASFTEAGLTKFVRDISGGSIANNWITKAIMQMRPVNASLKYFFGAGSGAQLAANSLVFNFGNYVTRVVGNKAVYDHPVVDRLLKFEKFLESQGRIAGNDIDPDIAGTGFNRAVDVLTGWIPGEKIKAGTRDVVKTGIHAIADWPFDGPAKRTAVMEALLKSRWGQSPRDLDAFLDLLENFDKKPKAVQAMVKRELDSIRGDSVVAYDQFFTNSGFAGVSRNYFSDWIPFSALQGYMVKRGSDVFRPIHSAIRNALNGDFDAILKDPELVRLIAATAYIGKIGAMSGRALEQDDPDEAAKHYALSLNDYYQGLEGSFFLRLLTSPLRGWDHSVKLADAKGETHTFVDGVSASAYNLLAESVASAFRELKPLNSISALAAAYRDTGDFGFALDASRDELEKVMTGMARFNLQEGFETAGLRAVPEPDDWLSYLTMTKGDANKSLKKAMELRDMEAMEKYLFDPEFTLLSSLSLLPVIKHVLDEPSYSGTKYGQYAKAIATDADLNSMIVDGKIPETFFTGDRVPKFWSELTKFDLSKYGVSSDGKSVPFKEGTHDAEKGKLFIDRLSKKMGDGNLEKFIAQFKPNVEAEQMARILAFAENDVPGSARVVLSYVAGKMYYERQALALAASGQNKYDKLMSDSDDAIKAGLLQDLYPLLYAADKTSFAKVPAAYLAEKYPAYFEKDGKAQEDIRTFTNSMALMDMAFVHEFKSGNPSANFVKNLFATTSKYVKDPASRLSLMNHALANVDSLPATKEDKFAMKLGILAGNVDNVANIAKDKVFASNPDNELLLKEGLDIFWKGHAAIQDTFRKDAVIGAINADLRKTLGYQSDKKSYGGKSYNQARGSSNDKAYGQYMNAVPAVAKAMPSWYQMPGAGGYSSKTNPRLAYDGKPDYARSPKWEAYMSQLGEARSQSIVTGYVEHFAGDKDAVPYKVSTFSPKWKPVAKAKLDMEKVRWKSAKRF